MTKRIIITGSAGYLGSKVVELLGTRDDFEIYGVDVREPKNKSKYKRFLKASVDDVVKMRDFFDDVRPHVAVHLAFVVTSTHDGAKEESVDVGGTQNFLGACERTRVPKVVFLSSVAAYGAFDDGDKPLTENSKVRGVKGYGYSWFKAKVDQLSTEFIKKNEWCDFVLLRPCLFVGPNTKNNFFDVLKFPIVPKVMDQKGVRDPEFQFIHEDDMALCLVAAIDKNVRGVFNVASDGTAKFSDLVKMFGKKSVAVPTWILYPVTSLLWKLHLVTSPPAQLDFIRYPWIMDVSKMRRELYTPLKNSTEAFAEFAKTHK